MRVGFGKANITPPLGTRMMGISHRDAAHGCTAIHDDIFVRALNFSHEDELALVMSFDLCFLGREDADRLKGVLGREFDLLPRQILLSATHSHVSPSVGAWYSAAYTMPDRLYLQRLEAATLKAARAARDDTEDATLWVGSGHSSLPMNRRRLINGEMENAPNPDGFVNDTLQVCVIKNKQSKPIAVFFTIATHPSIVRGFEISAEFCGVACDLVEEALNLQGSVFLQGTAGDSKPSTIADSSDWNWEAGWPEMEETGRILSQEVLDLIACGLEPVEPCIRSALFETLWPLQEPQPRAEFEKIAANGHEDEYVVAWAKRQLQKLHQDGAMSKAAPVLIQGIQLGKGLRLVAIEGEPVSHYGQMILDAYSDGVTFPLGYANGEALYLVTSAMLEEGGMEPTSYGEYGHPAPLAPGMEQVVGDALSRLRQLGVQ